MSKLSAGISVAMIDNAILEYSFSDSIHYTIVSILPVARYMKMVKLAKDANLNDLEVKGLAELLYLRSAHYEEALLHYCNSLEECITLVEQIAPYTDCIMKIEAIDNADRLEILLAKSRAL